MTRTARMRKWTLAGRQSKGPELGEHYSSHPRIPRNPRSIWHFSISAGAIFRPAAKRLSVFCCRPVSLLSVEDSPRRVFPRRTSLRARTRDHRGPAYFLAFFLVDFFAVFFLAVFLAAAISWLLRVWRLLVRPSHLPGRHGREDVVCRKLDK